MPSWATPAALVTLIKYMRTITIDKTTQEDLAKASQLTGIDEGELANRAISLYLKRMNDIKEIKKEGALFRELLAWDDMSDEALLNMERDLEHKA
jgi:hypothetical protein